MNAVQAVLSAIAVIVFVCLGYAMSTPELF